MSTCASESDRVRSVLVVGGSPERPSCELLARLAASCDCVIACDGGAVACQAAGVAPQVLVGDNDSLTSEALRFVRAAHAREVGFPMDKDSVDLRLAVSVAQKRFPHLERLVFCGVSGGRPDHALAVAGVLMRAAHYAPCVEEDAFGLRVLAPEGCARWELDESYLGRTLSVIAPQGFCVASEVGMRWDIDHATLDQLDDLGISNVVERMPASIEVHEGVLFAIVLRDPIEKRALTD